MKMHLGVCVPFFVLSTLANEDISSTACRPYPPRLSRRRPLLHPPDVEVIGLTQGLIVMLSIQLCVVNSRKWRYLFDSSQAVSPTAKPATLVTAYCLIVMLSIQLCIVNSSKRRYLFNSSQAVSASAKLATPITQSSSCRCYWVNTRFNCNALHSTLCSQLLETKISLQQLPGLIHLGYPSIY